LQQHGLDFVDAPRVFEGVTFTYEDERFAYGEQRSSPWVCWPVCPFPSFTRSPRMKSASSPSAKRPVAKRSSTPASSATAWSRLHDAGAAAEPAAEHPEADVAHGVRGIVRQGLKPVPQKTPVSLRLGQDALEWFRAEGPGNQTRINAVVLRAFRDASA
jgi:uncharacterized protein (DUF4415 family)